MRISFTGPEGYVFSNNKGEMGTDFGTYKLFSNFLERHNLKQYKIHFHALRQTFSNSLFAQDTDDQLITDMMGHSDISTTRRHYNSIQKFDSAQKTGKRLNAIYKPSDPKFESGREVTFAPKGYITENEAIQIAADNIKSKTAEPKPLPSGEALLSMFAKLSEIPEFRALLDKLDTEQKNDEIERD